MALNRLQICPQFVPRKSSGPFLVWLSYFHSDLNETKSPSLIDSHDRPSIQIAPQANAHLQPRAALCRCSCRLGSDHPCFARPPSSVPVGLRPSRSRFRFRCDDDCHLLLVVCAEGTSRGEPGTDEVCSAWRARFRRSWFLRRLRRSSDTGAARKSGTTIGYFYYWPAWI